MAENPVLNYRGVGAPSVPATLLLYDGSRVDVRAVIAAAPTTPGDATANWADAGPVCWVGYDGDPQTVEAVEYPDPRTNEHLRRRVVHRDAVSGSTGLATCKLHLSIGVETAVAGDFSDDFSSTDYFTG